MKHQPMEKSQRQLRVGEQLRHMIVETLQKGRFHDEALLDASKSITVTEVRPSPDLKNATVYVISLGGRDMDNILPALNEAAPYFQQQINKKLKLKFTPRLHFVMDKSFDEAEKIESILHEMRETGELDED